MNDPVTTIPLTETADPNAASILSGMSEPGICSPTTGNSETGLLSSAEDDVRPDRGQVMNGSTAGQNTPDNSNKEADTEYTKRMKGNFGFFGPATLLYACFYAFCMFRNPSGITFPFFIAGSLFFFCCCMSKLEISLKKGSAWYMTGMILLAISTFTTDDTRIIILNKTGIFLLMLAMLLKQVYDTSGWRLGKYLGSILALAVVSLGELGRPFSDAIQFSRKDGSGKRRAILRLILGLLAAIPIFLVVFALLVSADAVFRSMTRKLLAVINLPDIFVAISMIIFMFLASYCILSYLCRKKLKEKNSIEAKGDPVLAVTVTSVLTILYLVFSGIQIIYLFLGQMSLPDGYTYAEYAREGFFQLLTVSILNLVIVLSAMSFFPESGLLKGILTVMSLCTFIMIASSAMRMIIYIQYYYLTFLRILVLWTLAVLFLLFVGVVSAIIRRQFRLFGYSIGVVCVCYLLLSFSHPDYIIALVNISNIEDQDTAGAGVGEAFGGTSFFRGESYRDFYYLAHLNADAAPVLLPYLAENGYEISRLDKEEYRTYVRGISTLWCEEEFGVYYLNRLFDNVKDKSWRQFNLSRYLAEKMLDKRGCR